MVRALLAVILVSLMIAASCGGEDTKTPAPVPSQVGTLAPGNSASPGPSPSGQLSPVELGNAIFARASEAIQKLTTLLDGHPPAAQVKPKVAELKEATIQDLVRLGRQYEAMGAADRDTVDSIVRAAFNRAASADWYRAYAQTTTYYAGEDQELNKQIQSFNIITQYAFYELLKKQDAAEAQRLGIK